MIELNVAENVVAKVSSNPATGRLLVRLYDANDIPLALHNPVWEKVRTFLRVEIHNGDLLGDVLEMEERIRAPIELYTQEMGQAWQVEMMEEHIAKLVKKSFEMRPKPKSGDELNIVPYVYGNTVGMKIKYAKGGDVLANAEMMQELHAFLTAAIKSDPDLVADCKLKPLNDKPGSIPITFILADPLDEELYAQFFLTLVLRAFELQFDVNKAGPEYTGVSINHSQPSVMADIEPQTFQRAHKLACTMESYVTDAAYPALFFYKSSLSSAYPGEPEAREFLRELSIRSSDPDKQEALVKEMITCAKQFIDSERQRGKGVH